MAELSLTTVILFALFLIAAFIMIVLARNLGYDPVAGFLDVFSLSQRCEGRTVRDYERLIKGYAEEEEVIEQFQLCDRYRRCFSEDFALFQQKYTDKKKPLLCEVSP